MKTSIDDVFAGGKEVSTAKFGFNKVGDFIKGTYISYTTVPTQNGDVNLYEIKAEVGQYHPAETVLDENGNKQIKLSEPVICEPGEYYRIFGGKNIIDDGFKKVRPGTIVGIRFTEVVPSKKAGHSPYKVFKFVEFGQEEKWLEDNGYLAAQADSIFNN